MSHAQSTFGTWKTTSPLYTHEKLCGGGETDGHTGNGNKCFTQREHVSKVERSVACHENMRETKTENRAILIHELNEHG